MMITFGIQAADRDFCQSINTAKEKEEREKLSFEDKVQLIELLRLKELLGSQIWPNFGRARIPLLMYNDTYEFLVPFSSPPAPWTAVESDTFRNRPYYRRIAKKSQAFAVPVGNFWAGSLNTLNSMNQSMKTQLQENIPQEKLTPAIVKMMTITPAQHIVYLLHEVFHAFQADQVNERFLRANDVYASEKDYPFEDEVFKESWNKEGSFLADALREKDLAERLELIQKFLDIRFKRRTEISLSPELIAFEKKLEWLEGLAKYVELRFAELCSEELDDEKSKDFRIVRNRSRMDFYPRLNKLGDLHGDMRFYLSGAAQAKILDVLSPGWKSEIQSDSKIGLEDLLKTSVLRQKQSL